MNIFRFSDYLGWWFSRVQYALRNLVLPLVGLVFLVKLEAQSNYATPYTITTLAGAAGQGGPQDGQGAAARFSNPYGVSVDILGNLFVADSGGSSIRKVTPNGVVSTIAGNYLSAGSTDGTGTTARFTNPLGVAVDRSGNVYVADTGNHTIRKITSDGLVTIFAGNAGMPGSTDNTGTAARFNIPVGIALDRSGNLYLADENNHTIRKITADGVVTTFAGSAGNSGSADGAGSVARFYYPAGIAVDDSGNVYVGDQGNHTIRKITSAGIVTTLAGGVGSHGSSDGTGSAARFNMPSGVAVDGSGTVFVADYGNSVIREITSDGVVTTLAGVVTTAPVNLSNDGTGSAARFSGPGSVAVDSSGALYIADYYNSIIRKGLPPRSPPSIIGQPMSRTVVFGFPTTLSASVTGNPAPSFQWRKDGININSATGRAFTINTASAGDAGSYTVVVSNSEGSVISNPTTLMVHDAVIGDFNGDAQVDIIWQNSSTGQRALWLMNGILGGLTPASIVDLGWVDANWQMAGTGDFNADSQTDILWQNSATGQRALWMMNGIGGGFVPASVVNLGYVDTNWVMSGTGDFNNDSQTDILWQNTVTGQRALWLMNGVGGGFVPASIVNLGYVDANWQIAGTGDFNSDGKTDILWQNKVTGQRALWLMNGIGGGFTPTSIVNLGYVDANWAIASVADFDGDAQTDILWQNRVTGQRALWLMNGIGGGFTPASIVNLGYVDANWVIVH